MKTITFTAVCAGGNAEVQGTETRLGLVRHIRLTTSNKRGTDFTISDPVTGLMICNGRTEQLAEAALTKAIKARGGVKKFTKKLEDCRSRWESEKKLIQVAIDAINQITPARRGHALDFVKYSINPE